MMIIIEKDMQNSFQGIQLTELIKDYKQHSFLQTAVSLRDASSHRKCVRILPL